MHVALSPHGSGIQELGARCVVNQRAPRSWVRVVFFTAWLAFWTVGGIAAIREVPGADPVGVAFLLVWLGGWTFGELGVLLAILWELKGRESLTVDGHQVELRREIGRFGRTKRCPAGLVQAVRAGPALELVLADGIIRFGERLTPSEVAYAADVIAFRLGLRAIPVEEPRGDASTRTAQGARIGFPVFVCVALAILAVSTLTDDDSDSPEDRAAAMTLDTLSGPVNAVGRPECEDGATRTSWTCRVHAVGPSGRVLVYRCSSSDGMDVYCGPDP